MSEAQKFTAESRIRSFSYAFRGIRILVVSQHNAWIHVVGTLAVIMAGFGIGVTSLEWCALIVAIVLVWSAEALNTAIEFLCDVASPDFHPLIEKSKDVAAGAVLLSAIGATFIALLVFGPHVLSQLATLSN